MKLLDSLRFFARNLLHRAGAERDLDDELRAHIQIRADDLERSGVPRHEAPSLSVSGPPTKGRMITYGNVLIAPIVIRPHYATIIWG